MTGPEGHAERNIINRYAEQNNMRLKDIAASKPICCDCEHEIKKAGGNPVTPLKGAPAQSTLRARRR